MPTTRRGSCASRLGMIRAEASRREMLSSSSVTPMEVSRGSKSRSASALTQLRPESTGQGAVYQLER